MAGRLESQLRELLDAREEELSPEEPPTFEPFLCANCGYYNEPEEKPKAKAHLMVASRNGGRSG